MKPPTIVLIIGGYNLHWQAGQPATHFRACVEYAPGGPLSTGFSIVEDSSS